MTISTLTLAEAAALVPMSADRLAHWAELGFVPGAVHEGKHKHWRFNRAVFEAGLLPLQVMLADVERRGIVDGSKRNPATGLPFVACEVPPLVVEVTDAVRLKTVQEHMDADARGAEGPMAWTVPAWSLVLALAVTVGVLLTVKG